MIKYLSIKDRKRRTGFTFVESERLRMKSIIYNRKLSLNLRLFFIYKLDKISKNSSLSRIKNRCIITGRNHSIYRKFHLSRITLKNLMRLSYINNISKSSW